MNENQNQNQTENEDLPSKSELKRQQRQLQAFAIKLSQLSSTHLRKLKIPLELENGLLDYKQMTSHGALKRQEKLLGKIMRSIDHESLLSDYESLNTFEHSLNQRAEKWRDKIMEDKKVGLTEFINEFPEVDRQKLRQLVNTATSENKEKAQVAYKSLFKCLLQAMS